MAAQSDSSFVIMAKTAFQYPGLLEVFQQGGGSVSATSSKIVDNSYMVGSEATTAGVNIVDVYSKIDEREESFAMGSEAITAKVGATSVSYGIKIGEGFPMRYYFQELIGTSTAQE